MRCDNFSNIYHFFSHSFFTSVSLCLRGSIYFSMEKTLNRQEYHTMKDTKPIPVILDTDIGGDIDDTWALVMLLKSPELDLKLVTTCTGDTTYRAKVTAKILELSGRSDVPVGIGPATGDKHYPQGAWVEGYDLGKYPGKVLSNGSQALVDFIMQSPEPVTLIAIGPFTTIAEALKREPRIAKKCRIVAMAGNVRKPFGDATVAIPEYNVKADVPASQAVFKADWPITITPLDTCGFVKLLEGNYKAMKESKDPLAMIIMENYRVWCDAHKRDWFSHGSSVLFDTVAVHLAFTEQYLVMEDLNLVVEADGLTAINPKGKLVRCANEWTDLPGYDKYLTDRLVHGKRAVARK
jgi:inosine-uridine nucleoside N-ribohydrolase